MVVYDEIMRWDNRYNRIEPVQREPMTLEDELRGELLLKIITRDIKYYEMVRSNALGSDDTRMPLPVGFLAQFVEPQEAYSRTGSTSHLATVTPMYHLCDVGAVRNADGTPYQPGTLSGIQPYIFTPRELKHNENGLPVVSGTAIGYHDAFAMRTEHRCMELEITLTGVPTEKTKYELVRNWDPW